MLLGRLVGDRVRAEKHPLADIDVRYLRTDRLGPANGIGAEHKRKWRRCIAKGVVARGYAAVTTADIAVTASAGKQTIYRWWVSKAVLVLDALEHRGEVEIDPEQPSDRSLEGFFSRVCKGATRAGPALRALMAEAQFDPALRGELKERLIDRRRAALRQALTRWGIVDERRREALIFALYGALWYRLLLDEPLDDAFVADATALCR